MQPHSQIGAAGSSQQLQPALFIESQIRTGPLPSPAEIGEYERILPGTADRIIKMAEKEQSHRHQSEIIEQTNRMRVTLIGQVFAFLIGVSGISGGIFFGKI
jgi:uncharacterized membrane protein